MPHRVTVNSGFTNVEIGGIPHTAGDVVNVTDDEFSRIPSSFFTASVAHTDGTSGSGTVLTDGGYIGPGSLAEATAPTALVAKSSSQNSTTAATSQTTAYVQADVQSIRTLANALQTSYNAAQVDISSLYTYVAALAAALVAAGLMT